MARKETTEERIKKLANALTEFIAALATRDELENKNDIEETLPRLPVKPEKYDCFREQYAKLKHDISEIRQMLQEGFTEPPFE